MPKKIIKQKNALPLKSAAKDYLAGKSKKEKARLFSHHARAILTAMKYRKVSKIFNPWQDWEIKLVGAFSDAMVAKKTGRHKNAVRSFRRNHKIPRFVGNMRFWTKEEDKILLKQSSRIKAARLLNRPIHAIDYRIKQLAANAQPGTSRGWTKKEMKLLGKYSDVTVARHLKRTFSAVRTKRLELSISSCGNPGKRWTRQEDKLLGTMSDASLGEKLGRGKMSVFNRRSRLDIPAHFLKHRKKTYN